MDNLELFHDEIDKTSYEGFVQTKNWTDLFGKSLSTRLKFQRPIKTLSLFSGAGGLDIGFHDAGFKITEVVEIEKNFVGSIQLNSGVGKYFGNSVKINCKDIAEFDPAYTDYDFIIGGPPCQTFSAAGARANGVAGTKDPRGNLFQEYVRILKKVKPKGFLFENVYRIVGANSGKDWSRIIKAFSDAGYFLHHRILDTADYGVPQNRERLIIVGIRTDQLEKVDFKFPRPTHGPDSINKILQFNSENALLDFSSKISNKGLSGRFGHLLQKIPPGLNYSFFTEKMGHPNPIFAWRSKFSDFLYKADPKRPVRTIKAQGGQYTGPFHWENRPFTTDELKRLQTFPDEYKLVGGKANQIHQIGNSVPPQFARMLAISVAQQLFAAKSDIKLGYLSANENLGFRKRKGQLTKHYKSTAKKALLSVSKEITGTFSSQFTSKVHVGNDFNFNLDQKNGYDLVSKVKNNTWVISISKSNMMIEQKNQLDITIEPTNQWNLGVTQVKLKSDECSKDAFLTLWKAFDYLLIKNKFKADIIQLNGYYQYEPQINCSIVFEKKWVSKNESLAEILVAITNGDLTRKILTKEFLLRKCTDKNANLPSLMLELRTLGFEVRNSNTNISIDEGSYLIPYMFPTLTPQSVQRAKKI